MNGVKTIVFTRQIVVYNETFAPLGDKKSKSKTTKPVAMTWHEGEGKRSSQEICTAYIKFLNNGTNRDIENVTFWVDNCSAQNKCWWLFTALCDAINNERNMDLQSVTLKYFEKGHSFMSADSYHRLVEKGMKSVKNVYDFDDWLGVFDIDGKSVVLNSADFIAYPRGVSEKSKFTQDKPLLDVIQLQNLFAEAQCYSGRRAIMVN